MDILGEGTYGLVYKMCQKNNCWAVKKSKRIFVDDFSTLNEITILRQLNHKNIVKLLVAGFDKHNLYYTMPLASPLKKILSLLTDEQKHDYTLQLLSGMEYLASRNIAHLDLKIDNLLIDNGVLKIADFGFASSMLNCVSKLREYNVITVYYRPPEIFLSLPYTLDSDKWSVGCIIYEIFTGNLLFYIPYNKTIENYDDKILAQIFTTFPNVPNHMKYAKQQVGKYDSVADFSKIKQSYIVKLIKNLLNYIPSKRADYSSLIKCVNLKDGNLIKIGNCKENLDQYDSKLNNISFSSFYKEIYKETFSLNLDIKFYFDSITLLNIYIYKTKKTVTGKLCYQIMFIVSLLSSIIIDIPGYGNEEFADIENIILEMKFDLFYTTPWHYAILNNLDRDQKFINKLLSFSFSSDYNKLSAKEAFEKVRATYLDT